MRLSSIAATQPIDIVRYRKREGKMAKLPVLVLNGPNLNLLGSREPDIYGKMTLKDIEGACRDSAAAHGTNAECRQSNDEGELVGWIQDAPTRFSGLVINAGAYTHTSVALRDAIAATGISAIEVHISNVYARETFRHHSYLSPVVAGVIVGLGVDGYKAAIDILLRRADAG